MNLTPLDVLILALATWYVTYMLTGNKKGPFGVFTFIRTHFPLGGLTTCYYCAMPWIAAVFLLLSMTPIHIVIYPFAIAGIAIMLGSYTGANHSQ